MSYPPSNSFHVERAVVARGFSLVELLVVIAIIALLTSAGGRFLPSISEASTRTTARAIAGSLTLAQANATSMANYARLAFGANQEDGRDVLLVGIFYSKSGLPSDQAADWQLLTPPSRYPDMSVLNGSGTGFATGGDLPDITARVRGRDVTFRGGVLINPSGEFKASSSGVFARTLGVQVTNTVRPSDPISVVSLAAVSGPPTVELPRN